MTNRSSRIRETLTQKFSPTELTITDESHLHAGHSGARPEGETHFFVAIASEHFNGKSRIEMHRAVQDELEAEFQSGLHALRLKTGVPNL